MRKRTSIGRIRFASKVALLCSTTGLTVCLAAAPAVSQVADGSVQTRNEQGFGAIVVTARRVEENLQDVPVAISAIGAGELEDFQIDTFADVVTRVPALNVQVGGTGSGGQISLRGVGSSNLSSAFDSAVAFNFDGIQLSDMRLLQSGFVDVSQIEILRGPQSLFFGKSASAGVFSIRTADPTPNWEAGVQLSYEFEERGMIGEGYVSGPITDTLGVRLAIQNSTAEELVENLAPRSARGDRGFESLILRGTLQWDPAPAFDANLKVSFMRDRGDGAIRTDDVLCGNGVTPDPVNYPAIAQLIGFPLTNPGYDCNAFDGRSYLPDQNPVDARSAPPFAGAPGNNNGVPFSDTEIFFARLLMNLNLNDTLTLTSTTGYVDQDSDHFDLFSYGDPGAGGGLANNARRQFSQELRLTSDFPGPVNFMLGAFYESREIEFNAHQYAFGAAQITNFFNVLGVPGFAPFVDGRDPITGFTSDWVKNHFTDAEAWSAFGSLTVDISDRLALSGGVRFTDETKTNIITVPYVHSFLSIPASAGGFGFVPSGFQTPEIRFSDSNWSPEASIRYEIADDISVYAAFKTGFKSGGIDESALPSGGLLAAANANDFSGLIFDSETSIGGEIGFRSILADGALRLNATAFYYVFNDLQVQNFDAATIQFETLNAGEVTTQGFEVDWAWRTPLEGLSLSGAIAHLDAEYTDSFITSSGNDLNGRQAARAPGWSGNIAADWVLGLSDTLELNLGGTAQYSSSYLTNEETFFNDFRQDDYWSFDLRASLGDPGGRWRLSVVGINVGDEIWVNTSGGRPFASGLGLPDIVLTQNRGRQVFIELSLALE